MSNYILKSAWKKKMEIINIFDEKFLNEKDIALQPITFILEANNNIINDNFKKENLPSNSNTDSIKSIKSKKEEKYKSPKIKTKNTPKKKSIRNSGLYSSNIVIVQSITDGDSNDNTSFNIEKEVENLKRLMIKSKSKKNNKRSSKAKGIKGSNSAKY